MAEKFIDEFIIAELPTVIEQKAYRDAKSRLQEEAQERVGVTPTYEILKEWWPDHARNFEVGVFLGEEMAGQGSGLSKQEAQQMTAEDALKKKGW